MKNPQKHRRVTRKELTKRQFVALGVGEHQILVAAVAHGVPSSWAMKVSNMANRHYRSHAKCNHWKGLICVPRQVVAQVGHEESHEIS